MDPVTNELDQIEAVIKKMPFEVATLVRRSRRAIAEAQSRKEEERARRIYRELLNINDVFNIYF